MCLVKQCPYFHVNSTGVSHHSKYIFGKALYCQAGTDDIEKGSDVQSGQAQALTYGLYLAEAYLWTGISYKLSPYIKAAIININGSKQDSTRKNLTFFF